MDNKQIIGVLTGYKGISQAQAARLLHRTPQSLNMTINNNNFKVCDLLTVCDAFNISIDFKDSNNNIVLSIQPSHGDNRTSTAPADGGTGGKDNTPAD